MSSLESECKPKASSSRPAPATLNIPLLNRLRAAAGNYIPIDELGPDIQRLQDELGALAAFGFEIEQHPYRGAAYHGPAQRLCPDQIEHDLATRRIGRRIAVWNRVTSTNDLAVRAGTSSSNDGLVILAEEQTAGRGRRGRSWTAPACSSILMSVVLVPPSHLALAVPDPAFGCAWLTALAAVAAADLVTSWTGRDAKLKWPNDVRIDGRKIAGILVERVVTPGRSGRQGSATATFYDVWAAVIGIGVNVNLSRDAFPAELAAGATSMQIEAGGALFDRSELARDLIRRLDHWYDATQSSGIEVLNAPWQARSEHLGQIVRVATAVGSLSGRLVAMDLRHGLTLDVPIGAVQERAHENTFERARVPIADILSVEGATNGPGCR